MGISAELIPQSFTPTLHAFAGLNNLRGVGGQAERHPVVPDRVVGEDVSRAIEP